MKRRGFWLLVAAGAVVAGVVAGNLTIGSAGADNFGSVLTGFQETPAIVTPAFGDVRLQINDSTQTITWGVRWSSLTGANATVAHIHIGQTGVAGGVSAFFCGGGGKPACPPGNAFIQGTIVPADVIGPAGQGVSPGDWAKLVQAIRSGNSYANVHDSTYPGGEIRGQISGT